MTFVIWTLVAATLVGQVKIESKKPLKPGQVLTTFNFDKDKVGELPGLWRNRGAVLGKKIAEWQVVADATAPSQPNALAITKLAEDPTGYNLVLIKELRARVFNFTVRIKPVSGKEDQGGGIIWRAVDDENYYMARINPLERNFRVYKVVDGKRTQLGSVDVETNTDTWYTMQVISLGNGFLCTLDRTWTIEISDTTFPEPGLLGLWTKADAMSIFDDVEIIMKDKPATP